MFRSNGETPTLSRPNASSSTSSSVHGSQTRGQAGGKLASSSHAPSHQGSEQNLLHTLVSEAHERHSTSAAELHTLVKPRATNMACAALALVT